MSVTVHRLPLVQALKALAGTISRRTAHPAVGKVAIEVVAATPEDPGDKLQLAMTDFETTAWLDLLLGEDPGDLTAIVDAERLTRFLSQDPAEEVTLALEGGRGDLVVSGRSTAKLAVMPADSYAQNPLPPADGWGVLPLESLCNAFARASWAAGTGRHGSPSTLCLRAVGGEILDVYAMRDGRVLAGLQGVAAPGWWPWPEIQVSSGVAAFLSSRRVEPGSAVKVAVEPGRRTWWRGPGFQVAEQWSEEKHPDYARVLEEVGRKAPLAATLTQNEAGELVSGLHTLSGLGSWGLGSEGKRTDVLRVNILKSLGSIGLSICSDTVSGSFVIRLQSGLNGDGGEVEWRTSFPGELISALKMLEGGGDIEVRCHDGNHLFLFDERGGCASLSGRMP